MESRLLELSNASASLQHYCSIASTNQHCFNIAASIQHHYSIIVALLQQQHRFNITASIQHHSSITPVSPWNPGAGVCGFPDLRGCSCCHLWVLLCSGVFCINLVGKLYIPQLLCHLKPKDDNHCSVLKSMNYATMNNDYFTFSVETLST